jgi:hypothetical protein
VKFDRSWWRKSVKKYEYIIQDQLNEWLMLADQALHEIKKFDLSYEE